MRYVFLFFLCSFLLPASTYAALAPTEQTPLMEGSILRGDFVEEHCLDKDKDPVQVTGHFTVAPAYGLIWSIETPLPTEMIVTPGGAIQEIAGMAVKLPSKNLRPLYDMVKAALAGQWDVLENHFTLNRRESPNGWTMALYPKANDSGLKGYKTIVVQGDKLVQNIVLTKADGCYDTLAFSNGFVEPLSLTATEQTAFLKARKKAAESR